MKGRSRGLNYRQDGSITVVALVGLIPLIMGIGAFAIDMMHINAVSNELQKAADAGALAGADQLPTYSTPAPGNLVQIKDAATAVTNVNMADGQVLSSTNANVTVNVSVPTAPTSVNGVGGIVEEDITMVTKNIWAVLFAQGGQNISVKALATVIVPNTVGGAMPYVLDYTVVSAMTQGTTHTFIVDVDGQWTDFKPNPPYSDAIAKQYIINYGKSVANGGSPAVSKGQSINLDPGVRAVNFDASHMGLYTGQTIVFPVVAKAGGNSGPTTTTIKGWVLLKNVISVSTGPNKSVTGTLTSGILPLPATGKDTSGDVFISSNSPVKAILVQ
jgi:Flp pilus assembly protein TadG